jgi:glycosyltransferase involved in cell wall biosynthesis
VSGRDPAGYAGAIARVLDAPAHAATLARGASAMAAGYRWSTTAARLRRLYADLAARQLVSCA